MPTPIEVTVAFEEVFVRADPWLGSRDRMNARNQMEVERARQILKDAGEL